MSLFDAVNADASQSLSTADLDLELVVLHVGNAQDGLLAVYVGAPTEQAGQGPDWFWMETLWRGEEDGDIVTPYDAQPKPDLPLAPKSGAFVTQRESDESR